MDDRRHLLDTNQPDDHKDGTSNGHKSTTDSKNASSRSYYGSIDTGASIGGHEVKTKQKTRISLTLTLLGLRQAEALFGQCVQPICYCSGHCVQITTFSSFAWPLLTHPPLLHPLPKFSHYENISLSWADQFIASVHALTEEFKSTPPPTTIHFLSPPSAASEILISSGQQDRNPGQQDSITGKPETQVFTVSERTESPALLEDSHASDQKENSLTLSTKQNLPGALGNSNSSVGRGSISEKETSLHEKSISGSGFLKGLKHLLLPGAHTDGPDCESDPLYPKQTQETMEHAAVNGFHSKKKDPNAEPDKPTAFVYYLACFATIGGLLFGYDTGIVSGAMLMIGDYYNLNTIWKELIVSGTVGAAAIFALFAGFTCDYLGRKITIMIASLVFVAGAVVMGAAQSKEMLLVGRIVVGAGIGFASMTVPVYIAEAAPSSIRGRLVTLNQLFITIGILISSVVAGGFNSMKPEGWRYMLGLAGVPGIIQFVGFIFLPESPRWLVAKGKDEKARKVLRQIRGKDDVNEEVKEIQEALEESRKQSGFVLMRVLQTPHVLKAMLIGCGLQVFQQLCGINTVIYYSATILRMAGFPADVAIWLVLVPNGINFLATIAGVALVERLGRKKLLIGSFAGVVTALVVLAVGFQLSANFSPDLDLSMKEFYPNSTLAQDQCSNYSSNHFSNCEQCIEKTECGFCFVDSHGSNGSCVLANKDKADEGAEYGRCINNDTLRNSSTTWSHGYCPTDFTPMAVIGLALFVLAFAPGLGPMPWTINSEIYPNWARSTCNSIATGCNWICNLIVSLFFLTLTETITKYGAFWLFAGICFLGMLFTIIFVPETKNKSLEEVEQLFKGGKKGKDNLGYEKDITDPAPHKTDTRL
ncbi:proton myo-inositol cotransporter-like isoform X2 [Biomphalaria glabrata]|uniref:Proton myo-inositol cotransporter-like isoform X2 n=1 Tax=Biomphalaria glabrata TaxID=6526 RepID=A0A9W3A801_BIOGL|nr:proton myo-inositol cotransporter-like isoform X2 [Biomphalaria glabrata]XP_055883386.1 proton myo-inositol cotransporter-like isoform X2 [Biomphalaria glabrata]